MNEPNAVSANSAASNAHQARMVRGGRGSRPNHQIEMEAYGAAKARLFTWPALVNRVINIDDPPCCPASSVLSIQAYLQR
jgi:hypothetical protein